MKRILPVLMILASLFSLLFNSTDKNNRGGNFSTTAQRLNRQGVLEVYSHYEKNCLFNCGGIQVFKTYRNGDLQEFAAFREETARAFPGSNMKMVNENLVYFWLGWHYGVTIDGGNTWSIWSAEDNDLMREAINYDLIENVTIEADGKGKMFFNSLGKDRSGTLWLKTEDYGKTWHR